MEKNNIEIARSYSAKINIGNFESRDFFASAKRECDIKDAEATSKQLFHFCKQMVIADVKAFLKANPEIQYKEEVIDANKDLLQPMSLDESNKYDEISSKTGYF
jgi:hypothetical protein